MNVRELIGFVVYVVFYPFKINKIQFSSVYFHAPSKRLFEQIIKWYKKRNYRFLTIDEFYELEKGDRTIQGKSVFISLDDGRLDNVNLIEVCEKYEVPITIFATTSAIEKGYYWWDVIRAAYDESHVECVKRLPNTELVQMVAANKNRVKIKRSSMAVEQLKNLDMNKYVNVQAHTLSHPILPMCDDKELKDELEMSKQILEGWLNKKIEYFAYPCGQFSKREVDAVKNAGYKAAFTTEQKYLQPGSDNLYMIPRMEMNCHSGGKYENLAKMLGAWQMLKK